MTGFRSAGEWLSVSDATARLGVRRNAVHDWIKCGHLEAEESHRDGRGVHPRIHESEVARLEHRACARVGCEKPAPGPSGYCCGAHKRADEMRGKPRPELQKYPGQACEPRSCEDCGKPLGGKKGKVRGYLIAEGRSRVCTSCAQARRWAEPDEGVDTWRTRGRARTKAYRERVLSEIKRLQREGWLTTEDVVKRLKRLRVARTVVAGYVRAGHLKATPHEFRGGLPGGRLEPVASAGSANPRWFLYRETDVEAFEAAWLEGGDWRRQRMRDPDLRVQWVAQRWGDAVATKTHGRLAPLKAEQRRERVLELHAAGVPIGDIAQIIGIEPYRVQRALDRAAEGESPVGRRPELWRDVKVTIRELAGKGYTQQRIANALGVSRQQVQRELARRD